MFNDIKLYILNAGSLALSFTDWLEPVLKIMLLSITIGYTIHKWWHLNKSNEKNK